MNLFFKFFKLLVKMMSLIINYMVFDCFLWYVQIDMQFDLVFIIFLFIEKQKNFSCFLVEELKVMGIVDVYFDEYGYVYVILFVNIDKQVFIICFCFYVDIVIVIKLKVDVFCQEKVFVYDIVGVGVVNLLQYW